MDKKQTMDDALRDALTEGIREHFIALTNQINNLLDTVDFFLERYPEIDYKTGTERSQIGESVGIISTCTQHLSEEIRVFLMGLPRIRSIQGVESTILDEIGINVSLLDEFFLQKGHDTYPFNRLKANMALMELKRINTCIR